MLSHQANKQRPLDKSMTTKFEEIKTQSPNSYELFKDSLIQKAIIYDLEEMLADLMVLIAEKDVVTLEDENQSKKLKGEYKGIRRVKDYFIRELGI